MAIFIVNFLKVANSLRITLLVAAQGIFKKKTFQPGVPVYIIFC
jgi:hypothetical protein